jgi:hypothetical protein
MSMNVSFFFLSPFFRLAGAKVIILFNPANVFGNIFEFISDETKNPQTNQPFSHFREGKGKTYFLSGKPFF